MVRHQSKQRRRRLASGLVDATSRQGRVGHSRSGTRERRADARLAQFVGAPAAEANDQAVPAVQLSPLRSRRPAIAVPAIVVPRFPPAISLPGPLVLPCLLPSPAPPA
jgi:hypothetical protein